MLVAKEITADLGDWIGITHSNTSFKESKTEEGKDKQLVLTTLKTSGRGGAAGHPVLAGFKLALE